jgi:hypothetical protein
MPSLSIEYTTEAERLALEQAIAFCTQLRHVAATAPDGTVLAACEQAALQGGRRLLRDSLAAAVQARADDADAKKKCPAPARKGGTAVG